MFDRSAAGGLGTEPCQRWAASQASVGTGGAPAPSAARVSEGEGVGRAALGEVGTAEAAERRGEGPVVGAVGGLGDLDGAGELSAGGGRVAAGEGGLAEDAQRGVSVKL
jgi:hypothetical protein